MIVPEVSPIVGELSETTMSQAAMSDHRRASSTYPSRTTPPELKIRHTRGRAADDE